MKNHTVQNVNFVNIVNKTIWVRSYSPVKLSNC